MKMLKKYTGEIVAAVMVPLFALVGLMQAPPTAQAGPWASVALIGPSTPANTTALITTGAGALYQVVTDTDASANAGGTLNKCVVFDTGTASAVTGPYMDSLTTPMLASAIAQASATAVAYPPGAGPVNFANGLTAMHTAAGVWCRVFYSK